MPCNPTHWETAPMGTMKIVCDRFFEKIKINSRKFFILDGSAREDNNHI